MQKMGSIQIFIIGARTDAIYAEGIEKAIHRAKAYEDAGADFIFWMHMKIKSKWRWL